MYTIEAFVEQGESETYIVTDQEECQRLAAELKARKYIVEVSTIEPENQDQ